jgi:hypothetical protein
MTWHIADRIEATKIQTLILHLEKKVFLAFRAADCREQVGRGRGNKESTKPPTEAGPNLRSQDRYNAVPICHQKSLDAQMHKCRYYFTINGVSNAELHCSSYAAKSSFLVDPWRGSEGAYRSSITTTTQAHRVRADCSRDADIAQTFQTIGLG